MNLLLAIVPWVVDVYLFLWVGVLVTRVRRLESKRRPDVDSPRLPEHPGLR